MKQSLYSLSAGLCLSVTVYACQTSPPNDRTEPEQISESHVSPSPLQASRHSVASISIKPNRLSFQAGQSTQLKLLIRDTAGEILDPAELVIHWSSSTGLIVDQMGKVTASEQLCNATVTATESSSGISASAQIILCASNQNPVSAREQPNISWISANSGLPGQNILIAGNHLAEVTAVLFSGAPAQYNITSDNLIQATVPDTAPDGPITIITPNGNTTSKISFDNNPIPLIAELSQTSGQAGDLITVRGAYFSQVRSVRFDGAEAKYKVISDTEMEVTVPRLERSALIYLINPYGTASSTSTFELLKQIWYVKADSTGSQNGSSWQNAFATLQQALKQASQSEEIWVAAGTYSPSDSDDRTRSFDLKEGVRIYGGFAGHEKLASERNWTQNSTILSGDLMRDDHFEDYRKLENIRDNSEHVVRGANQATLDGFIIESGASTTEGGGIWNSNTSENLHLKNLILRHNYAAKKGGAIYNTNANPNLENVYFFFNVVGSNEDPAQGGAAIYNHISSPNLQRAVFEQNFAYGDGGAIFNQSSNPHIQNAVFTLNSADKNHGGAIFNRSSDPELYQVSFYNNKDESGKNGIYNTDSSPRLVNILHWQSDFINAGSSSPKMLGTVKALTNPFVAISDLDGPDNLWLTEDDGLQLHILAEAIDQGILDPKAPAQDILGRERVGKPDPGAYESPQ